MNENTSFREIMDLSLKVVSEFKKQEQKPWGGEQITLELAKQVGDLAKLVMIYEKNYFKRITDNKKYRNCKSQIADELADVMQGVFRLADHYGIDLVKAHVNARRTEYVTLGKVPFF